MSSLSYGVRANNISEEVSKQEWFLGQLNCRVKNNFSSQLKRWPLKTMCVSQSKNKKLTFPETYLKWAVVSKPQELSSERVDRLDESRRVTHQSRLPRGNGSQKRLVWTRWSWSGSDAFWLSRAIANSMSTVICLWTAEDSAVETCTAKNLSYFSACSVRALLWVE